jgi:gluconokinase
MIYILFGEMGVGKNYVGERLAERLGCEFFDGDSVIPKPMEDQISKFKILTPKVVRDFIYNHLIPEVHKRSDRSARPEKDLVVAQALYRRDFRESLTKSLGKENVQIVYIPAPPFLMHMARLLKRRNGARWVLFCLVSKLFFQRPKKNAAVIINRDGGDLDSQIQRLIK